MNLGHSRPSQSGLRLGGSLNIPKCKLCPLFKPQWVWFTAVELATLILSCSLNGFKLFRAWGSKADPDPSTLLQSERWDAPYLCTEKMLCSHVQADVQYHTKSSALICNKFAASSLKKTNKYSGMELNYISLCIIRKNSPQSSLYKNTIIYKQWKEVIS